MTQDSGNTYREFDIEIFHKGDPKYIVTIHEKSVGDAVRRATSAVWMQALKDGREWMLDDITGNEYKEN